MLLDTLNVPPDSTCPAPARLSVGHLPEHTSLEFIAPKELFSTGFAPLGPVRPQPRQLHPMLMFHLARISGAFLRRASTPCIFAACALLVPSVASSQTYDHVIPLTQSVFDGDITPVSPGDVIGVEAGERGRLYFRNIHGASGNPIIIVNKGGQVRIGNFGSGDGINVARSSHFELRGDGDPAHFYGFDIYKAGGQNIKVHDLSTDFTICFIELSNPGFAGIMAKTDPGAGYAERGTFTQYNTIIHDIYGHDIPGETFYIGNSFYAGGTPSGFLPHNLVGVRLYNTISLRTGREGIQVGSATDDVEIYNNIVIDAGLLRIGGQQNGIQLGEGTTGKCYNNTVINTFANGIVVLGLGDNLIYNNVIVNPATNGLFCDNRPGAELPGSYLRIYNNTIINPGNDGALIFNEITTNEFKNNIVVGTDPAYAAVNVGSGATVTSSNNVYQIGTAGLAFADVSAHDYRLTAGSSAIDVGANLSPDVTTDIEGLARPFGSAYDAGAHEAGALSVVLFSTPPAIHGATNGTITASPVGGTAPYTYAWSGGQTTASLSGLGAGTYSVTVTDAAAQSVVRTVVLTQPPELFAAAVTTPELAGANDGRVAVGTIGGTLPVSIAWAHGPTSWSLSSLDSGFYTYTVTDANGATVEETVFVRDAGTPVYRVNAGGIVETDRVIDWDGDKGTSTGKSPYVVSSGTSTTGSNGWGSDTTTEAPRDIFGSRRRTTSTATTSMDWEFPVTSGYYEVQLYFNEIDSAITGAGQRVFDIAIEGAVLAAGVDIYAEHGPSTGVQYTFLTHVTDGTLDVDLIQVTGGLMVSGIAVHSFPAMPVGTPVARVNPGGIEETAADGVHWMLDKQTNPSPFLASSGQLTTGSNGWNSGGTNLTDAPDDVFGNHRYDPLTGADMQWEFPVAPGVYRVNLYFIERGSTVTTGDRVFSTTAENIPFLTAYDIFDRHGYLTPVRESMILDVTDGTLDVDFAADAGTTQTPVINAISVHRIR